MSAPFLVPAWSPFAAIALYTAICWLYQRWPTIAGRRRRASQQPGPGTLATPPANTPRGRAMLEVQRLSGLWWPLLAKHLCAQQGPRSTIHAVEPRGVFGRNVDTMFRTVCGLDARLTVFTAVITNNPAATARHDGIVMEWPAPRDRRCTDCAALTGINGRQVKGHRGFQPAAEAVAA